MFSLFTTTDIFLVTGPWCRDCGAATLGYLKGRTARRIEPCAPRCAHREQMVKWTDAENAALKRGVEVYGDGDGMKWDLIFERPGLFIADASLSFKKMGIRTVQSVRQHWYIMQLEKAAGGVGSATYSVVKVCTAHVLLQVEHGLFLLHFAMSCVCAVQFYKDGRLEEVDKADTMKDAIKCCSARKYLSDVDDKGRVGKYNLELSRNKFARVCEGVYICKQCDIDVVEVKLVEVKLSKIDLYVYDEDELSHLTSTRIKSVQNNQSDPCPLADQ